MNREQNSSTAKCYDFGLLGRKLSHSWSPEIHSFLGNYDYDLIELEESDVRDFILSKNYKGLNVTIPYKKTVMPYLDKIDELAMKIGSVNTVVHEADDTLTGYNTDYFGFSFMLKRAEISVKDKVVIVLGSGGASLTATSVTRDLGAKSVTVISRHGEDNYSNLSRHSDAEIIINCTPVGMFPNNLNTPLELDIFPKAEAVVDMIYNPLKSALILSAEKRGINFTSGLSMLVSQAFLSSEYFQGKELDENLIEKIITRLENSFKNVVLIGMPGCGKSSVGAALARKLGREHIDTDSEIVKRIGTSIENFINENGEEKFRDIESEVVEEWSKQKNLVISTGGGCVLRERNRDALRQNSLVVFLDRDISLLPVDGRPISKKNNLNDLYGVRLPLYNACADVRIKQISIDDSVEKIEELLK